MCNKDVRLFSKVLKALEERSTCARIQVACLAVKEGRIVSTGWNGVESGQPHCKDHFANHTHEQMLAEHHQFSIDNELHAEENCINFAAKEGISLQDSDLYVSYSPCPDCAQLIIDAGVRKVYFELLYDRMPEGIQKLIDNGIEAHRITAETIIKQ